MNEPVRSPETTTQLERLQQTVRGELPGTDQDGSPVAKVFSSCMVLRGQEAKGR